MTIAAVCALQLWLALPDEIRASTNPYDQIRYLEMAESIADGEWLGRFDVMTLVRDVGYPLWVAAVHISGIPLRIANELLMLGSSLLLCLALLRTGTPAAIAALLFAILALQPHGTLVMRDLLPSSFYAALLVSSLAGMLYSVTARTDRWRWAHLVWTAIVLGILWTTRPEQPLIAVLVLAFCGCDFSLARRATHSIGAALARSAQALAIFACGIGCVVGTVAGINYSHYGVFRISVSGAPGYAAANRVLVSIEHENPRRQVPVPSDARRHAYAASAAFSALRPVLETHSWARAASCNMNKVCDDLASGYFRWILREAVAKQIDARSATALDSGLAQIARELEDACESGTLSCHRTLSSFLHPYPETYLPHLVDSLGRVLRRMASSGDTHDRSPARDVPNLAAHVQEKFDYTANRRVELAHLPRDQIVVTGDVASDPVVAARLDIAGRGVKVRLEVDKDAPDRGFRLRFEVDRPAGRTLSRYPIVELDRASGAITRSPIPPLGEIIEADGVSLETERWDKPQPASLVRTRVRGVLWTTHAAFIRLVGVVGVLSLIGLSLPGARGRPWDTAFVAIALIGLAVMSRLALLTMVDASSFSAYSSRYIYPIVSLFSGFMLLLTHRAWVVYRNR